ncbi:hypothetical protein JG687_00008788 [Phytophthora cactorum]|uniref:Uncharacterized protein n=1 Tax=Phytophthora cactorum TaxID=29920 RepID=A0A8T1UGI1_9STRA|nr:hypothetical protein GQ600_27273 [Phytophthora cactorum]KAG6959426.1 hypothetical protein JG687_00008788 [Phytophthora cactorum]
MLDGSDMPSRKLQKRLSDVRCIMTTIESEAKRSGLWQAQQSVEDAVNVFASCASSIAVPRDTAKHRKRRQGQLRDNRSDSAS